MNKRKTTIIIMILLIIAGLSLILYPVVSNYLKVLAFQRAINEYNASVSEIDDNTYEEILAAARAHNEKLAARGALRTKFTEEELAEYESLLNVTGTGIMGYVEIPKLNLSLPVYHGTNEAVLQSGVGHMEGSSLPIGGESTHAVLSGHTGLPSAQLFTAIDRLAKGDTFTVHVLNEVLTYEVDQILTVLPRQLDALNIVEGEDYCTLVTCTPYGVNTHRLLVRGHRIEIPEEEAPTSNAPNVIDIVSKNSGIDPRVLMIAAAVLVLLLVIIIILAVRRRKKKKRRHKIKERSRS